MIDTKFLINEIYPCLQGEGINLGKPSLLVRFQICNLRCSFCDTPYTHTLASDTFPLEGSASPGVRKIQRPSSQELLGLIGAFQPRHLIFSGGEPTLQPIHRLFPSLLPMATIEVETNGTQIPHHRFKDMQDTDYQQVQWNVSPKGANAGECHDLNSLRFWAKMSEGLTQVWFKFVVSQDNAPADLREIQDLVHDLGISPQRVVLMPEGTSLNSQTNSAWLHDICLETGYRFTPRLHVILFGDRRGV